MATEIILRQLLIFGILALVGTLARKRNIISEEIKNNLARIVIDVTLPFLIFTTFVNLDYKPELLRNGLLVFGLAYLNLILFYSLGNLSARLLKLKIHQAEVHALHTMLGNIVFFGFPLLDALFPNGLGIFYAAVYQLASNSVTFTFGVYRLSSGSEKAGWKNLINSNSIALILGATILGFGFSIPSAINVAFESLGRCTSPLSMIYIGAMLASMNIKKAILQKSIYFLSVNKLILAPTAVAGIFFFSLNLLGVQISKEAFFVLILEAAMPCQTIVVVLAHKYNSDHQLAGANLFVTTILSVVSLPIIYLILEWIWAFS